MFAEHQPKIAAYARERAEHFSRVRLFVILTIQQQLFRIPGEMETVEAGGPDALVPLWGFKWSAYQHIVMHGPEVFAQCEDIWQRYEDDPALRERALVMYLASLPGLGPVKAGFLAQLVYGVSGCLDSHNLVRLGLPPRSFLAHRFKRAKRLATRRRHVERYTQAVADAGGTAALWDDWCRHVATVGRDADAYRGPDHVSALHCEALGL